VIEEPSSQEEYPVLIDEPLVELVFIPDEEDCECSTSLEMP